MGPTSLCHCEKRKNGEWWKAQKWAYSTLERLCHRFRKPSELRIPSIMRIWSLSKKSQHQIFMFFNECMKPKSTWTLLKPHFENLVSTFVFAQLSFNDHATKEELWENDPVDYIRVSVSTISMSQSVLYPCLNKYKVYAMPISAATTFLFSLIVSRTKVTFMPILGFINTILRS
ncbi:uncharacterized protein LACBIDRAFT_310280 [Laccaria bicolor S238N-H82]|nr:uncharacterized protein LACBIDRAFT_310280 [Laccaria bicolor S238N-H82]EDQ98123.1 predicted protein [Laccaria bicolor S238N-H82]|eukprot:XP_001891226.1 predicted protein [Laccaria bicolor S238N-H82]